MARRKTLLNELSLSETGGAALPGAYSATQLGNTQAGIRGEEEAEVLKPKKMKKMHKMSPQHTPKVVTGGEVSEETPKIDKARALFKGLMSNPDMSRAEVITSFEDQLDVTNSTAVSYFQRLAKEAGLTNIGKETSGMEAEQGSSMTDGSGDSRGEGQYGTGLELPDETLELNNEVPESDDPDRQGVIRTIDNAHLVYKRENEEGTYDELWVYNTSEHMKDELTIRRAILAGTDIPPKKTESEDGNQTYKLTTMGNGQMLEITGLPQ